MSSHIEKYLDLYLEKQDTEYATLITGKWGCGKTYFINHYIENKSQDHKYKFIYISLFGLKSISEIHESIFQELHPILSHKSIKFLGGVLASAVKIGLKVDLTGDGKEDATINFSGEKLSFFNKDKFESIIFIFDDLERCNLSLPETLGFINSLCERQKLKVIVIVNEDEIKDNKEFYDRFKEKVVGKSLNFINNKDSFWENFHEKYKPKLIKEKEELELIKSIFEKKGDNNYRNLNRTTDEFIDFISLINPKFLENNDFYRMIIEQFYTISLEYRKNNDINAVLEHMKENDITFYYRIFFGADFWKELIQGNSINTEYLNNIISHLHFFNKKENSSWERLWHYREIDSNSFYSNLSDIINKFRNNQYSSIGTVLHVSAILIFFTKKNLCNEISITEIKNKVSEYGEINSWIAHSEIKFNGTGLGYINDSDDDFIEIVRLLNECIDRNIELHKIESSKNYFLEALPFIKKGDWSGAYKKYERYEFTTFLDSFEFSHISNIFDDIPSLYNLLYFIDDRYKTNDTCSGVKLSIYLKKEEPFIDNFINYIEQKMKKSNFNKFDTFKLTEILTALNSIKKRFN